MDNFWKENGKERILVRQEVVGDRVVNKTILIDDLYKAFKKRLIVELETEYGDLIQSR